MTPTFVEELFLRIEERLNELESEIHEIKTNLVVINEKLVAVDGSFAEIENLRRLAWVGRGIVLAAWGFIVTALNILIGRFLKGE